MKENKNPFRFSYQILAVTCCLALSLVFYCVSYVDSKRAQQQSNQIKIQRIMQNFELQLQTMEDISIRIASNYEFHPVYFSDQRSGELSMLKMFKKYRHYSALTENCFLYYGGERIFRSIGESMNLNLYIQTEMKDSAEQEYFKTALSEGLQGLWSEEKVLILNDQLYVLQPFRAVGNDYEKAILCFVVDKGNMEKQFLVVGGEIDGTLALYNEEMLLYCNQEVACEEKGEHVLSVTSDDGRYRLCYLPAKLHGMKTGLFVLQSLVFIVDLLLGLVLANVFAEKTYRPFKELPEKYRGKVDMEEKNFESALSEMEFLMDSMLKYNIEAGTQIRQKQEMIKKQVLWQMLHGITFSDIEIYLDKTKIQMPGPYYYVVAISVGNGAWTAERMQELELGLVGITDEKQYVYPVLDEEEKVIYMICSVGDEDRKNDLTEHFCDVVKKHYDEIYVGIGNSYRDIFSIHVSYLEATDNVQKKINMGEKKARPFVYDGESLRKITSALSCGDERKALKELDDYVDELGRDTISLLMRQYIFSNFLNEVVKVGEDKQLEISNQNISLIISAKNMEDFVYAARKMIHDLCESVVRSREEQKYRIFEYVNQHFAEYDMSMDKVARDMSTSVDVVSEAIYAYCGQRYKDYVISLRIEYAKKLLWEGEMSVAEICERVGYGNVSYFIKLFKKMTGVTPLKYKQKEGEK